MSWEVTGVGFDVGTWVLCVFVIPGLVFVLWIVVEYLDLWVLLDFWAVEVAGTEVVEGGSAVGAGEKKVVDDESEVSSVSLVIELIVLGVALDFVL